MRTVSYHVQNIIQETPLLAEVISEGIGNNAAIARQIHQEVERRALEKVSLQAITMALHRLLEMKKHTPFGFRFLKKITDLVVRSDLALFFVHNASLDGKLFDHLSAFERRYPGDIQGVTRGLAETLIIVRGESFTTMRSNLGDAVVRTQRHVSSITMNLPAASMQVPGMYYPILKTLAWEGINIVELVSAGVELTIFIEDKNVERTLSMLRKIVGTRH
jgi:hypothetical protein